MLRKNDKIENLSKRLSECRLEINSHILVLVSARCRLLVEGQNDIAIEQKKILEVVAFTQNRLSTTEDAQKTSLQDRGANNNDNSGLDNNASHVQEQGPTAKVGRQYQDVVSVLVTFDDETKKTISAAPKTKEGDLIRAGNEIETATVFRSGLPSTDSEAVSVSNYSLLTQAILKSLSFPVIHMREEGIEEALRNTFKWVFSRGDFMDFLERGSGFFWISGKAGSGKSTLMKFLHRHERTKTALKHWADPNQLILASFFFWNTGSSLQKSQEGLLRSILLEILKTHPDLLATTFPDLCRTFLRTHEIDLTWPRFSELKSGLHRLLSELVVRGAKVCLFIDGMDEYEGNPLGLYELLQEFATSPQVKLVVSSRPLNIFKARFGTCSNISMQNLNRRDIETYVLETLVRDSKMMSLGNCVQARETGIVHQVANRAEGVFLWAVLSVRSLLNGLYDGDTFHELQERLDTLPTELQQLYRHMLKDLNPSYREQAAKMFLTVLEARKILRSELIGVLQLKYACEETANSAIPVPQVALSTEERTSLCREMEKRISSRCCGLLEVRQQKSSLARPENLVVEFLHRTVVEFLESEQMRVDIINSWLKGPFDPTLALLTSSLRETKALRLEAGVSPYENKMYRNVTHCLLIAAWLEVRLECTPVAILDELDSTMSSHWETARFVQSDNNQCEATRKEHWTSAITVRWGGWGSLASKLDQIICSHRSTNVNYAFLMLACSEDCILYVVEKVIGDKAEGILLNLLFEAIIYQLEYICLPMSGDRVRTREGTVIRRFLQHGADPNAIADLQAIPSDIHSSKILPRNVEMSVWERYLAILTLCSARWDEMDPRNVQDDLGIIHCAIADLRICQSFLAAGAVLHNGFSKLREDPRYVKSIEEYERYANLVPDSVVEVLQELETRVCDRVRRTFKSDSQSIELESFRAEFSKTMDILHKRQFAEDWIIPQHLPRARGLGTSLKSLGGSTAGRSMPILIVCGIGVLIVALLLEQFC